MFNRLSFRTKLILAVLVIAVAVGGANIYQIRAVGRIDATSEELINVDVQRLSLLRQARYDTLRLDQKVAAIIRQSAVTVPNTPLSTTDINNLQTEAGSLKKVTQSYLQLISEDTGHAPSRQLLTQLSTSTDNLVHQAQQLSTDTGAATQGLDTLTATTDQLDGVLGALVQKEQITVTQQSDQIKYTTKQIKTMFVLITIGVTLGAILVVTLLARTISGSLTKLRTSALRIANGDFSVPIAITSKDELGQLAQSLHTMAERLKESYRRLAIEQQRDEAILQSMGEGLIATNEEGKILLINHNAAEYFNVDDQASVVGKSIYELYELYETNDKADTPLPNEKRPIFTALSTGAAVNEVLAVHHANGEKSLLDITATPIILTDKVVGAISVMRDVTKEKQIDRMKTEFISLASHQLRTPLSAIKWFTEMLVSGDAGELSSEQMEFAKNIDDSTERMIALVNALLNISRIESGRIIIDPQPTDLQELVSGIVNDLRAKTEERQQTLIISVHQDLPKINLDPRLIGQVYLNLLTNAIKYTPKGGEISVFISKKDDQIISQITDNGYGIPKDQQNRVFQKFFRAANAVKVETDGTGLGLYLIKAVVESSGGKIWFESEEGKGTTFWFSIPLSGMKPKEGEVTLDV